MWLLPFLLRHRDYRQFQLHCLSLILGPMIINSGQWSLYLLGILPSVKMLEAIKRPSMLETAGACIGLSGALLMLLDVNTSSAMDGPSFGGDMMAFLGAFSVCAYLLIGRKLREWMPLWLYAFPVVGFAALTSLGLACLDDEMPIQLRGFGERSVFGFFNRKYLFMAFYLGAGPGVCGHTVLNLLLKYMSPLTISTAMLLEPLLGPLLGYFFGQQAPPGQYTWIGGITLLLGLFLITKGEADGQRSTATDNGKQGKYPPTNTMPASIDKAATYGSMEC